MGINYPNNGIDNFTVPSDPENTPLSSAGSGTRNLTESIEDLGLGVTALEGTAAIQAHTHAGGADGTIVLQQAHTHANPDTDLSPGSIHHTIGPTGDQAAAGNHTHDYNGTSIYNKPLQICTSTTRPSDPQVGLTIVETDTNCERRWCAFPGNVLTTGLAFSDLFNRVNGDVTFDAKGQGNASGVNGLGSTHEFGAGATGVIASVTVWDTSAPSHANWNVTCELGTTAMTQIGVVDCEGSLGGFVVTFGLILPPGIAGTEASFSVNAVDPSSTGQTANINIITTSYNNLGAWGPVFTFGSLFGLGLEVQVPSSLGELVYAANVGALGSITQPTGNQRGYLFPTTSYNSLLVEDAPGVGPGTNGGLVPIGAWNQTVAGAVLAFNLIPKVADMGTGYTQSYVTGSAAGGALATPVSGAMSWMVGQNVACRIINVPTASGTTDSDGQDFIFTTGTAMPVLGYNNLLPTLDIYARRSSNGQAYVRLALTPFGANLSYTTTGPAGEIALGSVSVGTQSTEINWEFKCVGDQFFLYRGGVQVMAIPDQQGVTQVGASYRGWSSGASAIPGLLSQIAPANMTGLEVSDLPIYETELIWQLLPNGSKPYVSAECHVGQPIAVNNPVAAFFDTILEDFWGYFGQGSIGIQNSGTTIPQSTAITITESGHYDLAISVPWDPNYFGFDQTSLGFTVNGQDVGRKAKQFMRGNGYQPGFPQTNTLSTSYYFAAGDVLRVTVSHNSTTQSWLYYNGTPGSKQTAWVELKFTGP